MKSKSNPTFNPTFAKATLKDQDIIFGWLDKPYVREFWDNSQGHRDDILAFMSGRKVRSNYFNDIFTYWVGSLNGSPYCFILTAIVANDGDGYPQLWKEHLSRSGNTYTIDFCIGNEEFFGKGLAALTLEAFTTFFHKKEDPKADTFFIDPDDNNPRAIHVYAKAGFKSVGSFEMTKGFFEGHKSILMVKKLSS